MTNIATENSRDEGAEVLRVVQNADAGVGPSGCDLLLGFWFSENKLGQKAGQIAEIGLRPIGAAGLFEGWWYRGTVERWKVGEVQLAECEHYAAAIVQRAEDNPTALRALTRDAYIELFNGLDTTQHSNPVRIWNYFSDINSGTGDWERYRQFSIGRAEAFEELGLSDEALPAGTAIGTVSGNTLSVIALASDNLFTRVENPRQVSAYQYPRQYGPSSPKFSRGGVVSVSDHHLFLMSGTAAVIGHESAHHGDIAAQTDETLRNIESLMRHSDWPFQARQSSAIRVYLRDASAHSHVAKLVDKTLAEQGVQLAYLCGDICRQELLVEIDGAFWRN